MQVVRKITFNNGVEIPVLGLGTWQGPPGQEAEVGQAVKDAIDVGYRHFDWAPAYKNEHIIGEALQEKFKEGLVKREHLFIVSKLWNTNHRAALVEPALRQTLHDLKTDYVDLYLMHWPFAFKEGEDLVPTYPDSDLVIPSNINFTETWKALEEVYKKGLARSIGISNFNSLQIEELLKVATVVPATNQVECHPYLNQKKLRKFCADRGITITSYSPLGSPSRPWQKPGDPDVLHDQKIKEIAAKYKKSPAQILLRYNVQLGNIVIPKSSNKNRMVENIDIFGFELGAEDMEYIDTFDCNGRICPWLPAREHPLYPFKAGVEF